MRPLGAPPRHENGRGSHGEHIGDGRRREPWVFLAITSPRLPGKSGQRGYQNWIFIEVDILVLSAVCCF
jgi:hypothetical protein